MTTGPAGWCQDGRNRLVRTSPVIGMATLTHEMLDGVLQWRVSLPGVADAVLAATVEDRK